MVGITLHGLRPPAMATFEYDAYDPAGRVTRGTLEASTALEASRRIGELGLIPFATRPVEAGAKASTQSLPSKARRRLSEADLAGLVRELAALLRAEIPVDAALSLMASQSRSASIQRLIGRLHDSVRGGSSLSSAIGQHAPTAPVLVASFVRAGEARGNLADTLTDLSVYLDRQLKVRTELGAALVYPVFLAATALATVAIIVAFLVPALMPLFDDNRAPPPMALVVIKSVSNFLSRHWLAALGAPLAFAALYAFGMRNASATRAIDRLRLRLPVVGAGIRDGNSALIGRTLGTLLKAGVPMIDALTTTANVVPNRFMAHELRAAVDDVREGQSLGQALSTKRSLSDLVQRFVVLGEASGRLDQMLLRLADLLEQATRDRTDRLITMLGPALTIGIGLLVGGLILSVMQAILSVNDLILR